VKVLKNGMTMDLHENYLLVGEIVLVG